MQVQYNVFVEDPELYEKTQGVTLLPSEGIKFTAKIPG